MADASAEAGERLWQLPLPDDYRPRLDSPVADIKNIGGGRYGGALTAGLFLRDFVGDVPWAHLDIAGPAWLDEPYDDSPKGGTGFGVRTLIALIEGWADDSVRPRGAPTTAAWAPTATDPGLAGPHLALSRHAAQFAGRARHAACGPDGWSGAWWSR